MKDFEINIESDFIKAIPKFKKDIDKLAVSALRKTANQSDKEIYRLVTDNNLIHITFEEFVKRAKTRTVVRFSDLKGGIEDMNIKISITNRAHTSYRFFPTYMGAAKKKIWIGKIHGRAKKFYGGAAFKLPKAKPLFVRTSKHRYPLKPVFGPSVPDMLERAGLLPKLFSFTEENLRVNLSKSFKDNLDL